MNTKHIETSLNGKPSDTVPVQDNQLCDALYHLCNMVGSDVAHEYATSISYSLTRGDTAGVVRFGGVTLQWVLK